MRGRSGGGCLSYWAGMSEGGGVRMAVCVYGVWVQSVGFAGAGLGFGVAGEEVLAGLTGWSGDEGVGVRWHGV